MKTTLVIADDHGILREALGYHATKFTGFDVVASVADAQAAVNACSVHQPHLLLLDIEMPGRDALSAIRDIKTASPTTKVIILTAYCRDSFIQLALSEGVAGYLLKSDPPPAIFEALAKIAAGSTAYSKSVIARMSQEDFYRAGDATRTSRLAELTPRELEVLRYIGKGLDNDAMSAAMCISKRTVERHVARLMDAAAIRDRFGLMKLAYDQGLVS